MGNEHETSEGGSRILRHGQTERDYGVAEMDEEALEAIERHVRRYVGDPANVFHELVSDLVHIDVHIIAPSPERDCYTLFTTGMSDLSMTVPDGAEEFRYAELMLSLPSSWTPGPLWEADMSDESLYWPIRLLKTIARLPHSFDTWIGFGHTIPNGDPPRSYAPGTELCCALVLQPVTVDPEFSSLRVREDKTIHFYSLVPLYESEMHFKLKKGTEALLDGLDKIEVTELLAPKRPLAAKKKRFLFF